MANNIQTTGGGGSTSSQSNPNNTQEFFIEPTLFNFYYEQGNADLPPSQLFEVLINPQVANSHVEFEINYIGVTSGWITVSEVTNQNQYTHQIAVDPTGFNAGIYQAIIKALLIDNTSGDVLFTSNPPAVNLQVIATDFIRVTPANLSFSHQLGQALPPAQRVRIDSNIAWTATPDTNVLDVSVTSGNAGSANVDISLNANTDDLSAGTHNFQVEFENGNITEVLDVIVEVSGSSGFAVSPNILTFEWLRGSALPSSQVLHLFSDDAWDIVNKPSWLFVTPTHGNTSETLTIMPANITNMPAGNYNGQIEFNYQGSTTHIFVPVSLSVFNFLETDLEAGKFYFTKDTHWLNFTSNRDNTYIEITLNMLINHWDGSWQSVDRVYKLPLFQRKGKFHVGEVVHQFMPAWTSQSVFSVSGLSPELKAAVIDVHVKEIDISTNDVYFETNILSLRYLKGKYLGDILDNTTLKRIFINEPIKSNFFIKNDTFFSIDIMYQNTLFDHSEHIDLQNSNSINVYRLSKNFGLLSGSIVTVFFKTFQKKFITFQKSRHFSKIIFENSYGLPEIFYTNGKWRLDANYKSFENKVRKDLAEVKVTALVLATQKLIIHTGFIFNEEVPALDALMKSRQIYIYNDKLDGVQIRPVSKRIVAKDYENGMLNYKLEFELIENTDDQIYS